MQTMACRRYLLSQRIVITPCLLLLTVSLFLPGCDPGGSSGSLTPQQTSSAPVEQQAIESLLALYREAMIEEDIDRLQALLQPVPALAQAAAQRTARQAADGAFADLAAFRQALSDTFRTHTLLALDLPAAEVAIAPDRGSVTFLEVESTLDPASLTQATRVFRTTWRLARGEANGVVTVRIAAVTRQGPLATITTPGHVQAGPLTRVQVTGAVDLFPLASVAYAAPDATAVQLLRSGADRFHGAFAARPLASSQALVVRLRSDAGQELVVPHHYGIRGAGEGVVQRVAETGTTRFFAVTVAADGTVWAGGDGGARLYRVAAGDTIATLHGHLLPGTEGRIEDLTLDGPGRLHAVVFAPQASGVVVLDHGVGCQTVNVLDATYPLRLTDGRPSPSTRAVAAGSGAIWLHGSDAGLARVTDPLTSGHCPPDGVTVTYAPVLRREDGDLLANTVPALLVEADGALWVGSALGLSRLRQGAMTPVPFDPALSFQGNPATLEQFFQAIAQALFEARPLSTVRLGEVSFIEAFGRPLVKADVVFSLAQDRQGQLWVGTLGGGLRRVEARAGVPQDTLHLTREEGLASNLILALAVGPDGAVWAATDEGVSRIEVTDQGTMITTLTAGDGLPLPARDLAIDAAGTVWVATDGGLYRIAPHGGQFTGVVQDAEGQPVEGVDVLLLGTPVRTVTDARGQFVLGNLPPGPSHLLVDGQLATHGPRSAVVRDVTVTGATQTLTPVVVTIGAAQVPVDAAQGGQVTFPLVPGATLEIPAGTAQFPPGMSAALALTLVAPNTLATPLPRGFTAVAAAALQPTGVTFRAPVRVTLPAQGPVVPGQLVLLLGLDNAIGTYAQVGIGRVSADGTRIQTLSGGLTAGSTVVFAAAPPEATKVFLLPVAGNKQRVEPGEALPAPLVVRLEDQFGHPVVGEPLQAVILRGDGTLAADEVVTDAQGEAQFQVQASASATDLVVQVAPPDVPNVRPVQFLTIVGALDTPGFARDVAVADGVAYVADLRAGLQVIEVQDPTRPVLLHGNVLGSAPPPNLSVDVRSVAVRGTRAYVGTQGPPRLFILDITDPRAVDFAADTDRDGVPDIVLGIVDFPDDVQAHAIFNIVLHGALAYALSTTFGTAPAALYVVDIADPVQPRLVSSTALPATDPTGLLVAGDRAYVAAAGFLVFDVHDPTRPTLLATLGDSAPEDAVTVEFVSQLGLAGEMVTVVERRRHTLTQRADDVLTVIDVRIPSAPHRRGSVPLRPFSEVFLNTGLVVADPFAYVVRGSLGLEAVDLRDPDAPRVVGLVRTPSIAQQVTSANTVLYVTDVSFGLQVIQGPGMDATDTDGDGVPDFFDAFPTNPTETEDSDGDRLGNTADADDDNDSFTDAEEAQATPPTDPIDPRQYPLRLPPPDVTTLVVDATTSTPLRARLGTPEAPYGAVTEAVRVVRSGLLPGVHTIEVRPGLYASLTTQETFPLDLGGLAGLTLRAAEAGTAILDAANQANVINAEFSRNLLIEGFVVTHGVRGINIRHSTGVTLRANQARDNTQYGLVMGVNANQDNVVQDNLVEGNVEVGILIAGNAVATVEHNLARHNPVVGIAVALGAHAIVRHNVAEDNAAGIFVASGATAEVHDNMAHTNGREGIVVTSGAHAEVYNNEATANGLAGISVGSPGTTATLVQNVVQGNGEFGLRINTGATADVVDNTVVGNDACGIGVAFGAVVTLRGNTIRQNRAGGVFHLEPGHGVCAGGNPFGVISEPVTVTIGFDTPLVTEITDNDGAGIALDDSDGSTIQIDSRQIVFDNNAEGELVGNVCDVAAGPC